MRRFALLLLPLFALPGSACTGSSAEPRRPSPPPVTVLEAAPRDITLSSEWIATLDGYVNAQIRPQVSGYLVRRVYHEGATVRKGEVLFEIDSRPFEASLAQARGQLEQAQAALARAQRDLERDRPLAEQRAIPQSQLDNDVQSQRAADAAVKSATAAVETAQLNLGFTKVRSLIDGVAAIATAQIGDLVGPSTLLTTVSQVDPIRAYFSLSEQEYMRVAERLNASGPRSRHDSPLGPAPQLELVLSDNSVYPRTGRFDAADRDIDPKTGTIRISAAFPNPGNILRPGQYGRVRATTEVVHGALLVPERAVSELQGTQLVRVLDGENKISTRRVTIGSRVGPDVVVSEGLAAGDRVVVEGPAVPPGTVVSPRPYTPPAAQSAAPADQASGQNGSRPGGAAAETR